MMTFGEKLGRLRKQRGLSQEELAVKLDVSRQAVSKWELGTTMPDIKNAVLLSDLFDVSTDYLLKDEPEEDGTSGLISAESRKAPAAAAGRRPAVWKTGLAASGLGAAGILILAILSSVCPAVIYDPPRGEVRTIIRTGFRAFLELHNIYWLFGLCCILILSGVIMLIVYRKAEEIFCIKG